MIKQKMSETPRTDEHLRWRRDNGLVAVISREFARGLEIELAEARAEIERKDALIEQMREALKGASAHFDRNYYSVKNDPDFEDLNDLWRAIEAALAAERGE